MKPKVKAQELLEDASWWELIILLIGFPLTCILLPLTAMGYAAIFKRTFVSVDDEEKNTLIAMVFCYFCGYATLIVVLYFGFALVSFLTR